MKKIISLLLVAMMCVSLCACGGTESASGDNNSETKKESGFSPNQPTKTTEQKNTETQQEETNSSDMTVEKLKKYYDVEKYVGTPTIKTMMFLHDETEDAYCFINSDNYFEGILYVEYDERLEILKDYECIVCDNDTPNNTRDDVIAYIFID